MPSIFHIIGEDESECGYCSQEVRKNLYLYGETFTTLASEYLLYNGWRRCGSAFYQISEKPKHCIPRMVIIDPDEYEPSHSQRRVLNKFERYLKGELEIKNGKLCPVLSEIAPSHPNYSIEEEKARRLLEAAVSPFIEHPIIKVKAMPRKHEVLVSSPFFIANPSLLQHSDVILQTLQEANTDFPSISIDNNYINFHTGITPSKVKPVSSPVLKPHVLRMELVPPSLDKETFELYKKYQLHTFGGTDADYKEKGFMDFLGESNMEQTEDLGTFWWKWYLDDVLIAFSVLDIYEDVISSVYFVYDVDYKALSLGIVSTMKEIELSKQMNKDNYSLGLYIYECPKMHYKLQFHPSRLFCHTTRKFVEADDAMPYVEQHSLHIYRMGREPSEEMQNKVKDSIRLVVVNNGEIKVYTYKDAVDEFKEKITQQFDPYMKYFSHPFGGIFYVVKV